MIDGEHERAEKDDAQKTEDLVKKDLMKNPELLERVGERKKRRFIWSGVYFLLAGILLIIIGLLLHMGAYSIEGLIVGIGVIFLIIGIVRFLIGLIKPIVPSQL